MRKTSLTASLAVLMVPSLLLARGMAPATDGLDLSSLRITRVGAVRGSAIFPPNPNPTPGPTPGPNPGPTPGPNPGPNPRPTPGGIDPGIIVNIGEMIMKIIEENRPVVNASNDYATAVPAGIQHWTDLAGWNEPEATEYTLSANSLKGAKAIEVRFLVMRTWGGNYQGKGQYLTGVTVEPIAINVGSGYHFSLGATVPKETIANVGTSDNPLAAMVLKLHWRVQTSGSDDQGERLFYIQGDGFFREITNPSVNDLSRAQQRVKELLETPLP